MTQKFLLALAISVCGATFTFASTQYSNQRHESPSVLDGVNLSQAKALAVKATLLDAEKKKSLILRQAREKLEQLEAQKADRLAEILTDEELKTFDQLELSWREEKLTEKDE